MSSLDRIRMRWRNWDESGFIRKVSRAGFVLVILWMLVTSTYNSAQSRRLLDRADGRELRLELHLDETTARLDKASEIASDVQAKLNVAIAQNDALSEQLRQLGATPVVVVVPGSSQDGSGSPGGGSTEQPTPTTQPGPQEPPGNPPLLGDVPGVFDPVCRITAVLNLCT